MIAPKAQRPSSTPTMRAHVFNSAPRNSFVVGSEVFTMSSRYAKVYSEGVMGDRTEDMNVGEGSALISKVCKTCREVFTPGCGDAVKDVCETTWLSWSLQVNFRVGTSIGVCSIGSNIESTISRPLGLSNIRERANATALVYASVIFLERTATKRGMIIS
jgi:hypothetical protein